MKVREAECIVCHKTFSFESIRGKVRLYCGDECKRRSCYASSSKIGSYGGTYFAMSIPDVAEEMGCSKQNVSSIESRALLKFRRNFMQMFPNIYKDLKLILNDKDSDYLRGYKELITGR